MFRNELTYTRTSDLCVAFCHCYLLYVFKWKCRPGASATPLVSIDRTVYRNYRTKIVTRARIALQCDQLICELRESSVSRGTVLPYCGQVINIRNIKYTE